METKLNLITEKARKEEKYRFWTLMHLLNAESLRNSFYKLKVDKACGVDEVTMSEYERDLDKNIEDVLKRMKKWSYKPQPVKNEYTYPKQMGK